MTTLLLAYLSIGLSNFVCATELDQRIPSDHNHPIIDDLLAHRNDGVFTERLHMGESIQQWPDREESVVHAVEVLTERGNEVKRAPDGVSTLANNAPQNMNIELGVTQGWMFPKDAILGPHGEKGIGFPSDASTTGNMSDEDAFHDERKRQTSQQIWITINTCLQPDPANNTGAVPPQLQLYYSTSADDQKPGPSSGAQQVDVEGGFGMIEIEASDDVYVGVSAPSPDGFTGSWNYEIAASNDAPFHFWSNHTDLLFVDGDNHAALLITPNLYNNSNSSVYQQWLELPPPFGMFAHDQKNTSILGVSRSYCGLRLNAKIAANVPGVDNNNVGTMTNRGIGRWPKEQFYVSALNASSSYWGFLAMTGNSTNSGAGVIGGGGRVWSNVTFKTKASDNCALMYNLTFCSEVAYAVPSNPETYSPLDGLSDLAGVYDSYASAMYQNFNYSLQQIACNTTPSAQYSLAHNCDDCARAYKQWLCAVTIPRCEDWGNNATYLAQRNVIQSFPNGTEPIWMSSPEAAQQVVLNAQTNTSRNSQIIDEVIKPGPYKEVLPCIDLCYELVRSCPASFQFGCPEGIYQNLSYGTRDPDPGVLSCSYLGAAYYLNDGASTRLGRINNVGVVSTAAVVTTLALLFL